MSAVHEHDEDVRVLFSALSRPHPVDHDDPDVLDAAIELLRLYGHTPDHERTAA